MVSQFFPRTPLSNTGLNSVHPTPNTIKVDWLQGVLRLTHSEFLSFVGQLGTSFADTFGSDGGYFFSGRKFDHNIVSGRGAIVAWNIRSYDDVIMIDGDVHSVLNLDVKNYDVLFSLPAKVLSGCESLYSLFFFYRMLIKWNFRPTRMDIASDDYSKSLSPSVIRDAFESGLNHGFRTASQIESWSDDGFTLYLGSKKSDKLVRYYNKEVESGGEVPAYRFEVVYRDDYAVTFWKFLSLALSSNQENYLREEKDYLELLSYSLNAIDFYSLAGDKDSEKLYCSWWLDFKQSFADLSSVRIVATRVKTALDNSIEWVHKQVETTLASIEYYYQETGRDFCEWLHNRIESGRARMTDTHCNRVNSQVKLEYAVQGWF
jgi:hypothetical protein